MTTKNCFDCKGDSSINFGSHWGDGHWRCGDCTDKRQVFFAHQRADNAAMATCDECGVKTGGPMTCTECCCHDEYDHGICLDCGGDFSEDLACAAYDRAKDARKYGA